MSNEEETKQILIEQNDGEQFIIEIPSSYKLTYGPVAVGQNGFRRDGGSMALRIYESEKQQRAIFTSVKSFRDLSLKMMKKRVTVEQEEEFDFDNQGRRHLVRDRQVRNDWVEINNPDDLLEANGE